VTHETEIGIVAATTRLRNALQQVADALATPQIDALLAGEGALERALAAMPRVAAIDASQRESVGREVDEARRALMRCRRLGAALTDVVRIAFDAQGRGPAYGPRGATPAYDGRSVSTRV
jgi:hypothetical protein